jgi:hypothetical protein
MTPRRHSLPLLSLLLSALALLSACSTGYSSRVAETKSWTTWPAHDTSKSTASAPALELRSSAPAPVWSGRSDDDDEFDGSEGEDEKVETGTDPRDFADKFMPYTRFTKLENDIEATQWTAFGLKAITPKWAMTYELPLGKQVDYSDFDGFKMGGGLPPGGGENPIGGGGVPPKDLDPDGDNTGMGDLILRVFGRIDSWKKPFGDEGKSMEIMPTMEMTLPTATDDVLGGETVVLSPAITIVTDLPGPPPFGLGFVAGMNFFDFDVMRDDSRDEIRRYRGRYFWMQPLRKPGPGVTDGLYVLTEFQPIYDFEQDDFDLWIGPEFGKILNPKIIAYAKPGWGIDTDPEDRDWSFEFGMRFFLGG